MRDEKGRYATGTGERGESSLYQGEVPSKGMIFMGCQHGGVKAVRSVGSMLSGVDGLPDRVPHSECHEGASCCSLRRYRVIALSLRSSINICVQSDITCLNNKTLRQANPLATNTRQPNVCTEIV